MTTIVNNNTIIKKKKKLNSNKEQDILEQEVPVYTVTAKDHLEQFVNLVIIGAVLGLIVTIVNLI